MLCPTCGTSNRPEAKFCRVCGATLSRTCPNGHPVAAEDRFCDLCGAALAEEAPAGPVPPAAAVPEAERRLVSVLFADLVGFTSLSESRDAEEVRGILSAYFDRMREVVVRHGGVVEKFIGDAVMAVWGAPLAHEDDAERAVRAGLAMTDAVAEMNEELDLPPQTLALRVGVLTGEAAVTVGAEGQGMVAGDLVNTASRVQSVASSGTVLVGEATRRATEAAVAYEERGVPELKGKAAPVPVWRAVRIVAGRRGSRRAGALEPPFVGREGEMRLVRELFHSTGTDGKARLVSVVGIAGIGKSRLSWEFEKYVDGLAETFLWHRGRCLAYGEGVTYWALAEMVRMRTGILEEEDRASALGKLREGLERHVTDPEERKWLEPRLAHLLDLEERTAPAREDLFSAWRLFFERLAEQNTTVMVFEDLQWADSSLLEFIEYLLEWSRSHPLFVLTLSRPELSDRHPNWGAGKRNFTSLFLEPLSADAMEVLLGGLVPGLPEDLRDRIRERAEGVPLYAVETVRMLLDRGLLQREDATFRLTAEVGTLEVPETLHALIAARLDGLSGEERRVLTDASVLGKTFSRSALAVLAGMEEPDVDPILSSLVRKELLGVQADPRSPERGQYGFLQSLVREVAYQTLSRKERKARHLAIARYLETSWGAEDEEVVEITATHYLEAYRAAPDAPDAGEIKARARETLERAGQRARSLAANGEAERYFSQAMELADDSVTRAQLAERAGETARAAGRNDAATASYRTAIDLFDSVENTHAAARVSARLAEILWDQGHLDEGLDLMRRSMDVLVEEEPDEDLAILAAQLARLLVFRGELEEAAERVDLALRIAEWMWLPEVLSQALNTKHLVLSSQGRYEESRALLKHALEIALQNDVQQAALRARYNLVPLEHGRDRTEDALEHAREGLQMARRLGDRWWEWGFLGQQVLCLAALGDWDEALVAGEQIPDPSDVPAVRFQLGRCLPWLVQVLVNRGELDQADRRMRSLSDMEGSTEVLERGCYALATAMLLRARGEDAEALRKAEVAGETVAVGDVRLAQEGVVEAAGCALSLGHLARARELVASLSERFPRPMRPVIQAQTLRLGARIAAAEASGDEAGDGFKAAVGMFREVRAPFWLAVTLLEHGEWLLGQGKAEGAEPLLTEARQVFERLGARPWLDRLARALGGTLRAEPIPG